MRALPQNDALKGKRILYVQNDLLNGGPERVGKYVVNGLRELGADIDMLLLKNARYDETDMCDIKIHWLLSPRERVHRNRLKTIVRFIKIAVHYDIIVAGFEEVPTYLVALMRFFPGKKTVAAIHINLTHSLQMSPDGKWSNVLMRLSFLVMHKVVCVSDGVREDLVTNFGVKDSAIKVIYNASNLEEADQKSSEEMPEEDLAAFGKPVIINAGRLEYQKGQDVLLKTFRLVLDEGHDLNLVILGNGKEKQALIRLALDLGISERVFFPGHKINPFKYMARSKLFVLSSRYEGFAMVLLEALTLGLPVVSTDCPYGPAELLENNKSGLIVPADDAEALAQGIIRVLNDEVLYKRLSSEGRIRANHFDRDKAVGQYYEVLASL